MIDAHIELVLGVGLIPKAAEIVCGSRRSSTRIRIEVEQGRGYGVEGGDRNEVSGVRTMVRGAKNHALAHLDCVAVRVRRIERRVSCRSRCNRPRRTRRYEKICAQKCGEISTPLR